jgi:uncharacterized protein
MELDQDLTDKELLALEKFLSAPELEETSMDVFSMDGYFAALALNPRTVMPSEWIPWIWDRYEGEAAPAFTNPKEAERAMSLVMRLYNSTVRLLVSQPEEFEPIFAADDVEAASAWCRGFLLGMRFDRAAWTGLMREQPGWFATFLLLASEEGLDLVREPGAGEPWLDDLLAALVEIQAHWVAARREPATPATVLLAGPTAGRNDPCPCGSGKKFKRCCGTSSPVLN